jgi:hypothetical protein
MCGKADAAIHRHQVLQVLELTAAAALGPLSRVLSPHMQTAYAKATRLTVSVVATCWQAATIDTDLSRRLPEAFFGIHVHRLRLRRKSDAPTLTSVTA